MQGDLSSWDSTGRLLVTRVSLGVEGPGQIPAHTTHQFRLVNLPEHIFLNSKVGMVITALELLGFNEMRCMSGIATAD